MSRSLKPRHVPRYPWEKLSDEQLLSLRFCDLKLSLRKTRVEAAVERLYGELEQRGLKFRPHCWLSQEWFSPDGIPGIAIPFYLAHPRLMSLERRMMREVEGGNQNWLMRILRHEAGHALDSAYRLRRRGRWREVFGPASLPYPEAYRPRPGSRRFVQHLGAWYAQAHPTEDFAETFAVWLKPRSTWRREYRDWPAFAKLTYIGELAQEIGRAKPVVRNRSTIEAVAQDARTLREHYEGKRERYLRPRRSGADELLLTVFAPIPRNRAALRAATLLRELRTPLRKSIVRAGVYSDYLVHQVLRLMISRCDALNLYVAGSKRELRSHLLWIIGRLAESYEDRQLPRVTL
jgi:hypothetical protein